jgi:hypothetical protein
LARGQRDDEERRADDRRRDRAGDERPGGAALPGAWIDRAAPFTAPGASINTGSYESYVVPIRNGRPVQDTFGLATQGFEIVPHRSEVTDFTDRTEVDSVYILEVIDFVKERTGADEVVSRGSVLRRSAAAAENASQPQAALVHIDCGPEGAGRTAARVYAERFPDGPGYRRALATSFWRVFSPPPQDWPLALCDFRSVHDDEGLPNQLYFVDRIPDDPCPSSSTTPITAGPGGSCTPPSATRPSRRNCRGTASRSGRSLSSGDAFSCPDRR